MLIILYCYLFTFIIQILLMFTPVNIMIMNYLNSLAFVYAY